jgi:mRNA interferase MazF
LVLQTDALNRAGHASTIVIPGTSQANVTYDDLFPLRVRLPANAGNGLRHTTDLLIDQVRAVSNRRLLKRLGTADAQTLARTEQALRLLIG